MVSGNYTYDSFGNLIAQTGGTDNSYLFAGEQYDAELGDYYLRARYYNPQVGRFTTRDPFGGFLSEPVSLHKYLYANANPVNEVDPSGEFPLSPQEQENYDRGHAAHKVIASHFILLDPSERGYDLTINQILKRTKQNEPGVKGNTKHPDLTDFRRSVLYEIKPNNERGKKEGLEQMNMYLSILNVHNRVDNRPFWREGSTFEYTPPPLIFVPTIGFAKVEPPKRGIILYQVYDPLDKLLVPTVNLTMAALGAALLASLIYAGGSARSYGF